MIKYTIEKVSPETTREKRLEFLAQYFLAILIEDSPEDPNFNLVVLDSISQLKERFKNEQNISSVIDLTRC